MFPFVKIDIFDQRQWSRPHMTEIPSFALITSFFLKALPNEILAKRWRSFLHVVQHVKPCDIRYVILSR